MDWEVRGKAIGPKRFAPFTPIDVLDHYDGPRIFTLTDSDGGLCLACWSDEDNTATRFIVAPVSPQVVTDLKTGLLSVRESLDRARVYLVDVAHSGEATAAWRVELADIPADASPQPRVMLHRELEPFFSLRAIGDTIERGQIPGSVIRATVEAAQRSIKILAEYELERPSRQGRPSHALRDIYDLPSQLMRAASFEIAFRTPLRVPSLFDRVTDGEYRDEGDLFVRVGRHMRAGLDWLTEGTALLPDAEDDALSRAIVEAMQQLTPSTVGPIRQIEVRGRLIGSPTVPKLLDRSSRQFANAGLSRVTRRDEPRVRITGKIWRLDSEKFQFDIRSPSEDESATRVCRFEPELWSTIHGLLGEDAQVEVYGTQRTATGVIRVLDIYWPETQAGTGGAQADTNPDHPSG